MEHLPEDADERRMFDESVKIYGDPLRTIRVNLVTMSRCAPPDGSYGKMLAIWANELQRVIESR